MLGCADADALSDKGPGDAELRVGPAESTGSATVNLSAYENMQLELGGQLEGADGCL